MDFQRIVLHVDMDAFYASVEEQLDPSLRGRPVVIGADPREGHGRGVVSTANYVARKYGIHSAMPIGRAYAACPDAVFIRPDFGKYKAASRGVMEVLRQYADECEVVGLDEAYLDVTETVEGDWGKVPAFCRSLQAAVKRQTGLSCSVGAAASKSIAKIASDHQKPHGATVVTPASQPEFLEPLPVKRINGCGPKTTAALAQLNIQTIGDLAATPLETLSNHFGKHGAWLQAVALGRDHRPVRNARGPAKSRGNERTYLRDEDSHRAVVQHALKLVTGLLDSKDRRPFATISIKLRYEDFTTITRSHTLSVPLAPAGPETRALAHSTVAALLRPALDERAVRLVGVRISNFTDANGQQSLACFGMRRPLRQARAAVPKSVAKSSHHRMALL